MLQPQSQQLLSNTFETQPEALDNVIELTHDKRAEVCQQQYEEMVANFKNLAALYHGDTRVDCFEYPAEIILATHENGNIAAKALLHPTSPIYGSPGHRNAGGFKIYECQYSAEQEQTNSKLFMLSLGHAGSDRKDARYPNNHSTRDEIMQTRDWLNEHLPISEMLLSRCWEAAADPALNPKMALSIHKMMAATKSTEVEPEPITAQTSQQPCKLLQ